MLRARHKLLFQELLGNGSGYLLDQNLLDPAQYLPGGWLLERHSRATTATRVNSSGVIESVAIDVPRLQHDKDGNALGYLHEPQATNEVVESEDFSTWTATGLTATGGQADPTGGSDAYLLAETAVSLVHFLNELSSIAAGEIAMSVFAKRATGGNYLQLRPHGIGLGKAHASFDLDAGTVYATGGTEFVDAYIESMAGGWYRCVLVGDYAVAPSSLSVVISNDGTELPAYTGNTSNAFYIFGAQMELGSRATSYIPTNGAAATRAADDVAIGSVEFSSFWTGDPVTFVFHGSVLAGENLNNRMVLSNASKSRRWCYANFPGRGNADEALVVYDGSSTPEIVDDVRLTTPFKYAIAIEAGQVRGSFNGGSVGTGVVNSNLLSSVSDFALFKDHGGVCALLRIIPGAVSDAQLQSLTAP